MIFTLFVNLAFFLLVSWIGLVYTGVIVTREREHAESNSISISIPTATHADGVGAAVAPVT